MKHWKEEKIFIYIALIFGTLMVVLTPPFQSPDEGTHFFRAYTNARGDLYPQEENGVEGFYLPDSMVNYVAEIETMSAQFDKKYSYKDLFLTMRKEFDYQSVSFHTMSTVNITPIAYTAPSIGVLFAKITNYIMGFTGPTSLLNLLYSARFFSLFSYIAIVALAIRKTPILKKSFALIALIPMSLFLGASVTYDNLLIPCALLTSAIILELCLNKEKKITWKHLVFFGVMGFFFFKVKLVYIVVLLPILCIPKEKFGQLKDWWKKIGIIVAIAIVLILLNELPTMFHQIATTQSSLLHQQQVSYIFHHPLQYLETVLSDLNINRFFYLNSMFGVLGLLDTSMIDPFVYLYIIAFLVIIIADASLAQRKIKILHKLIYLIGILGSIFGIITGMYILWTSEMSGIGVSTVVGVQGRYFLPLLSLFVVLFVNSKWTKNKKVELGFKTITDNYSLLSIIGLSISCLMLLLRFW